MANSQNNQIHVFRAGEHKAANGTKLVATQNMLKELVGSFNPQNFMVPAVKGHPKDNDPAFGWVSKLTVDGDDLYAQFDEKTLDENFKKEVNAGRYKNVSVSIYPPKHPNNPTPGKVSLRHVGFLGAMAPAVKGLTPVNFSDEEDGLLEFSMASSQVRSAIRQIASIFRRMREQKIEESNIEEADKLVRDWEIETIEELAQESEENTSFSDEQTPETLEIKEVKTMSDEDMKKQEQLAAENKAAQEALKAEKAELEKQKQDFAESQAQKKASEFISKAIADKKITKGHASGLNEFMAGLDDKEALDFGEGNKKSSYQFMVDFISSLPQIVDFTEHTAPSDNFSVAAEDEVSAIRRRADQLVKQDGLNFSEAVNQAAAELEKK